MTSLKPYRVQASNDATNICLFGNFGIGKTWFAATAQDHPAMADVLFLNVEGGMKTVAARGDIHAVDIHSVSDLEAIFWKLANGDAEYKGVRTVVIDSGSELQTLSLEEIVTEGMKKGGKRSSQDDIWQEDYGKSTAQLKRLFRWFRDLPLHTIVTAHERMVFPKGKEGQQNVEPVAIMPQFTQKLCKSFCGYMDHVWYMYQDDEGGRCLLTQPDGLYEVKTRGVRFAKAIGEVVELGNDPENMKATLGSLLDQYVKSETKRSK